MLAKKEDLSFRYLVALKEATKIYSSGGVLLQSVAASMNKKYNLQKELVIPPVNNLNLQQWKSNQQITTEARTETFPSSFSFGLAGMSCFNVSTNQYQRMKAKCNEGSQLCCHCQYPIQKQNECELCLQVSKGAVSRHISRIQAYVSQRLPYGLEKISKHQPFV